MGRLTGKDPIGATPIDDASGLKDEYITTRKELYEVEFANINDATIYLFSKKYSTEKLFSYDFLLNIHKRMLKDVWNWAGTLRKSNLNIGTEWHQIRIKLTEAIKDILFQDKELDPLTVSAVLYYP